MNITHRYCIIYCILYKNINVYILIWIFVSINENYLMDFMTELLVFNVGLVPLDVGLR